MLAYLIALSSLAYVYHRLYKTNLDVVYDAGDTVIIGG